jgi:hypothetical protein
MCVQPHFISESTCGIGGMYWKLVKFDFHLCLAVITIILLETGKLENYRGIQLLNSGYKIYGNIIINMLYTYYRSKLGEEQKGFWKVLTVMAVLHCKFLLKTYNLMLKPIQHL